MIPYRFELGTAGANAGSRPATSALEAHVEPIGPDVCANTIAEGEHHRLVLTGALPPGWCTNLAAQCFQAGIGIVSGEASELTPGLWRAEFLLDSGPLESLARYDFVAMAHCRPAITVPPLGDHTISVRPAQSEPGALFARVDTKDDLGLLASVLDHFDKQGLYPHRMSLRTAEENVVDWFWLRPRPDSELAQALEHEA